MPLNPNSNMAALPQQPEKNLDKLLAEMDMVPLFMKNLPAEASEDPTLAALQSLAHDGTPDEIAENFKNQGNEYFKGKRYREALGFYTQGLDAAPTEPKVLEALLNNRAACNLELENYGQVLRDCARVITANPKSSKAYYRCASALLKLDRLDDAIDCCKHCLEFDTDNQGVQTVLGKAEGIKATKERKEREKEERLRKKKEAEMLLAAAYRERNILVIPNPEGSQNPYSPHFDSEIPTSLVIPVFFLYPQHATSDVITEFHEDTPFAAHIETMFPPQTSAPEWDKNGEYMTGNLVVYAMTRRKRLLKVGKKMTLRDVCTAAKEKQGDPRDGLELKDGCLTFVVVPKGDVETKWVEEFKRARDQS